MRKRRRRNNLVSPSTYAYRISGNSERFEVHFRSPGIAFQYLLTPAGRSTFRMGLEAHRQVVLRQGGYSPSHFEGLHRWLSFVGGRRAPMPLQDTPDHGSAV